jgi:hypothetical protein
MAAVLASVALPYTLCKLDLHETIPPRAKCAHTCVGILSSIALHVPDFYVSMLKKCEETIHIT